MEKKRKDKKMEIRVNVSPEMKARIQKKSEELGVTMSSLMIIAANDYLKQDSVIDLAALIKGMDKLQP
jgi:hypothetical protein